MDDSAIIFDEVIDADYEAKLYDETWKDGTYKTQRFYVLLAFLLLTIA